MKTSSSSTLPLAVRRALVRLGRDISAARRRRRLPLEVVAERAFTTRQTVARVEKGDPTVALGTVATILFALGLNDRVMQLAAPSADEVGLALEEERLPERVRLPRRAKSSSARYKAPPAATSPDGSKPGSGQGT